MIRMTLGGAPRPLLDIQTTSYLKLVYSKVSNKERYIYRENFRNNFLNLRIFLFLELLSIKDSAATPRDGTRRGELWAVVSFNISTAPILLVNELERMSRGMTNKKEY